VVVVVAFSAWMCQRNALLIFFPLGLRIFSIYGRGRFGCTRAWTLVVGWTGVRDLEAFYPS